MMKIIYAFLTFVAIACARPSRQPQQQSNSVTFENQETQNLVNVIKTVNHLTDDDIAEGFLMIKELDDKTQELVAHGKEKYEDFLQLSMLLKESAEQQLLEYEMEAEKLKEKELPFNFNDGCMTDEDCNDETFCYPVAQALKAVLEAYGDIKEYDLIAKKTKIHANECVPKFSKDALYLQIGDILVLLDEKKQKLDERMLRTKFYFESKGIDSSFIDISFLEQEGTTENVLKVFAALTSDEFDATSMNAEPTIRQLSDNQLNFDPMMLIILSQRGNEGFDTQSLLMAMMMAGSGASGDTSLTSNPLLLMTLLDNDESDAFDVLLKLSLMGEGSSDLMSNPLMLTTLLSGEVDHDTILPLLLSQDANNQNGDINPLVLMSLLGGDSFTSDNLLPILLMNGEGKSINPLLLMSLINRNDDTAEDESSAGQNALNKLLPILLMNSGLGDKSINPLLLMLLSNGNSESISDLLPILMMTNALGDENGSVNPLLLMTLMKNKGNSIENLLPILLMNGGIGNRDNSMNPLLLMTLFNEDSDGGVDTDMLLPMLLSGGSSGGNMSSLLPFLLMSEDNGDDGDDTLLLFMLLNMQATS